MTIKNDIEESETQKIHQTSGQNEVSAIDIDLNEPVVRDRFDPPTC